MTAKNILILAGNTLGVRQTIKNSCLIGTLTIEWKNYYFWMISWFTARQWKNTFSMWSKHCRFCDKDLSQPLCERIERNGIEEGLYQNLLLARTGSSAQSFILKMVGLASFSVGKWRPTTWYWWNLNVPCTEYLFWKAEWHLWSCRSSHAWHAQHTILPSKQAFLFL